MVIVTRRYVRPTSDEVMIRLFFSKDFQLGMLVFELISILRVYLIFYIYHLIVICHFWII